MYAYIEKFSGEKYVAQIEKDTDYRPVGAPGDIDAGYAMRLASTPINLSLRYWDEPISTIRQRKSVGMISSFFSSNRCVEITKSEYITILEADGQAAAATEAAEEAAEVAEIKAQLETAQSQTRIPTPEEAKEIREAYNNLYNEGVEGYIPTIIDTEQYARLQDQFKRRAIK